MKYNLVLLIFFTLLLSNLFSQVPMDTTKKLEKVTVKMKNGDEFRGKILQMTETTVVLETANGTLNLISANISSIKRDTYTGKFRFPNSNDTRYFFGPSAIPIQHKKGYYQNVLVTTNFVNYGILKNFSIGGGFEFFSTIFGSPIWFLTPKVGFKVGEKSHVGGGFIMAGFANQGTATMGYGVYTIGNSETNATIGIGYGLISGKFYQQPTAMVSGTHRLGNGIALLSENYFIPNGIGTDYFGIQGIRLLSPKNSFDIGALIIPSIFQFIPALPYIGYTRSF